MSADSCGRDYIRGHALQLGGLSIKRISQLGCSLCQCLPHLAKVADNKRENSSRQHAPKNSCHIIRRAIAGDVGRPHLYLAGCWAGCGYLAAHLVLGTRLASGATAVTTGTTESSTTIAPTLSTPAVWRAADAIPIRCTILRADLAIGATTAVTYSTTKATAAICKTRSVSA